jgi:twitching motility protein PilT
MQTMDMALLDIVARGLVTKDEAQSRSSNPNLFGAATAGSIARSV